MSCANGIFKFSGAGNDFVVLDGRSGGMEAFRQPRRIGQLCREYHTDGLMILTTPSPAKNDSLASPAQSDPSADTAQSAPSAGPAPDFQMEFYNPDGSGGMMCGNGGRCIVAFADYLGLQPASPDGVWRFLAPDGLHEAQILEGPAHPFSKEDAPHKPGIVLENWTVRLKMIDVSAATPMKGGYFLNTGTRHFVKFVPDVDAVDVQKEGYALRWDPAFQPEGTNVNFVQMSADGSLHVRTFEKGVEAETLACGTGLTASAIAAWLHACPGDNKVGPECPAPDASAPGLTTAPTMASASAPGLAPVSYRLQCRRGDWLQVDFQPSFLAQASSASFSHVYLTGPAEIL